MSELDELKKLSPKERIAKLKEIEEERKKEIEEAEELIKESEAQAEEEERFREQVPIPQVEAADIEHLFAPEEKEVFAARRPGEARRAGQKRKAKIAESAAEGQKQGKTAEEAESLEESVWKAAPELTPDVEAEQRAYQTSIQPMQNIYQQVTGIVSDIRQTGDITDEQRNQLAEAYSALEMKQEAVQTNTYQSAAENIEDQIGSTRSLIKKYLR